MIGRAPRPVAYLVFGRLAVAAFTIVRATTPGPLDITLLSTLSSRLAAETACRA